MSHRYLIGILLCILLLGAAYDLSFRAGTSREEESGTEAVTEASYEAGGDVLSLPKAGSCLYLLREAADGTVSVYRWDGETLYEETGIQVSSLPGLLQLEIRMGKPLKNAQELYSFLENYSS